MERAELEKLKLEALRLLAMEQGLAGVSGLGRAALIDQLSTPPPEAPVDEEPAEEPLAAAPEPPPLAEPEPEPQPEPAPAPPPLTTAPPAPSAPNEPLGILDLEELPETYGVDECELLFQDPAWVFAWWEVTDGGLQAARAQLGPSAGSSRLVLRLFSTVAGQNGVDRQVNDVDLPWNHGRRYLQTPKAGAHLRVAVGLLSVEGYFAPIAHSSLQRLPPVGPAPDGPVEWAEVVAGETRGAERETLQVRPRGTDWRERGVHGGGAAGTPGGARGNWASSGSGGVS